MPTMRVRMLAMAVLLVAVALGGCSSKTPDATVENTGVDCAKTPNDPLCNTQVDDHTGAIKCVVTDSAIKPIAGVAIKIVVGKEKPLTATTGPTGTCAFSKVPPGTYFIQASKAGYLSTQTAVEVKANVVPAVTKVLLQADPASTPFFELYPFEGYIECSAAFYYATLAVCSVPNNAMPGTTTDNFLGVFTPARNLTFAQGELVWEATQATGEQLKFTFTDSKTIPSDWESNLTKSPVIVKANATQLARITTDLPLITRIFSGGLAGTEPGGPVPDPSCVALCLGYSGVGATVEQKVNEYVFLFYGFRPPVDYSFAATNEQPKVPA